MANQRLDKGPVNSAKNHPGERQLQPAGALDTPSVWASFRRLMAITAGIALAAVVAAAAYLYASGAPARWELYAAVAGGVAGTLLLTGALMGLVFVSSRSGHDDNVDRRFHDN